MPEKGKDEKKKSTMVETKMYINELEFCMKIVRNKNGVVSDNTGYAASS